jgi:uncharacterized protein (DUF1330 family)
MPKGYCVVCYRSVKDPDKLAAYAKLAGPAIQGAGGRFLVRGVAAKTMEAGLALRTIVVEFESVDKAYAAYQTPAYKEALRALGDAAERDMRFVEGVA